MFASAIPWRFHRNRQQELALQLAKERRVLFVEPPTLRPRRRSNVERVTEGIWRAQPPTPLPLGRFVPLCNRANRAIAARSLRRWLDRRPGPRLLWIDEDLATPLRGRLGERAVVYDVADLDWTFTRAWNRRHLRRSHVQATRTADLVLASSPALKELLAGEGRQPIEILNACDPRHVTADGPRRRDASTIPGPRLGYIGALDERAFDARLVAELARLRPDWSFLLAGPAVASVRRALVRLPNVHLLGAVAYEELPALLRTFDVCLIPYRLHERVRYVQPKKLYEYLAAGKPVVATPLPAVVRSDAPVRTGRDARSFASAVEAALLDGDGERLRAIAKANSWDARGAQLAPLLGGLGSRRA